MQVTRNVLNISDVYKRIKEKTLVVNKAYQRGSKLWPIPSRSYFIDTILNGYPFPKITIRQIVDPNSLSMTQEIVDGQQRIGTIVDFLDNSLRLSSTSKQYAGKVFADLSEEEREAFLAYEISVDIIVRATDEEVLETFRRMNSYMLPLNKAELRYSQYQGTFKWFIAELTERYSVFFQDAHILTLSEISRMRDSELLTECAQIVIEGIVNKSDSSLESLYKRYDIMFENKEECEKRMISCIDYIKDNMFKLYDDSKLNGYLFYSLFSALYYNRYGYAAGEDNEPIEPSYSFCADPVVATELIREMIGEVELRRQQRREKEPVNNQTRYAEFAQACESSTHRQNQRLVRRHFMLQALQTSAI